MAYEMRISDCSSDVCSSDLLIVRDFVGTLRPPNPASVNRATPLPPRLDPQKLYGIIPPDVRAPYDVHEVIGRIVDDSAFHEFKALYGTTLVCGFAHIWGIPVSILANNGVLRTEEHTTELLSLMRNSYAVCC